MTKYIPPHQRGSYLYYIRSTLRITLHSYHMYAASKLVESLATTENQVRSESDNIGVSPPASSPTITCNDQFLLSDPPLRLAAGCYALLRNLEGMPASSKHAYRIELILEGSSEGRLQLCLETIPWYDDYLPLKNGNEEKCFNIADAYTRRVRELHKHHTEGPSPSRPREIAPPYVVTMPLAPTPSAHSNIASGLATKTWALSTAKRNENVDS